VILIKNIYLCFIRSKTPFTTRYILSDESSIPLTLRVTGIKMTKLEFIAEVKTKDPTKFKCFIHFYILAEGIMISDIIL